MVERHGAAGVISPNRSARGRLARGLAVLCALLPALVLADEPSAPAAYDVAGSESPDPFSILNYGRAERLPPVEPLAPAASPALLEEPAAPLMSVLGTPSPYDPFARQVSYNAAATNTTNNNPLSGLGPGQPFRFSALQEGGDQQGDGEGGGESAAEQPNREQVYGQAPTNNSLQFLRDVDVLLAPGKWQADTGFVYAHFANDFPLPVFNSMGDVVNVVEGDIRRRLLFSPLAARYGLTTNIQLFSFLPVGFSNTQISTVGDSQTTNVSGLGDLTAGASVHLLKGEDQLPDVIGTFGFTAPTGKFSAPIFGLVPGSNLGQGFWAYSAQLLFINRYDPVIVFYGAGYRHLWERSFDGALFAPGEQINYMLGVGFAVNDRVTLSSTFQGFYITNTQINGEYIRGTTIEPMTMRFAATIVRNCRIIEPFVQIGVTDSAPRANLGIVVTFY